VLELVADSREVTLGMGALSTSTTMYVNIEPAQGGAPRYQRRGGLSRREERRGMAAAVLRMSRRQKTMYGGFRIFFVPPRSFGSSKADLAPPCHYPLSQARLILDNSSPGKRRGSHSKPWSSTDTRTVEGVCRACGRVPSPQPSKYAGEVAGKNFSA
jgi:hypothetical protein